MSSNRNIFIQVLRDGPNPRSHSGVSTRCDWQHNRRQRTCICRMRNMDLKQSVAFIGSLVITLSFVNACGCMYVCICMHTCVFERFDCVSALRFPNIWCWQMFYKQIKINLCNSENDKICIVLWTIVSTHSVNIPLISTVQLLSYVFIYTAPFIHKMQLKVQ